MKIGLRNLCAIGKHEANLTRRELEQAERLIDSADADTLRDRLRSAQQMARILKRLFVLIELEAVEAAERDAAARRVSR